MMKRIAQAVVVAHLLLGVAASPQAALEEVDPGPYSGAFGFFPVWYEDSQAMRLELCLSRAAGENGPMCVLNPAEDGLDFNPAWPVVFPVNFPDEAFWFIAEAGIRDRSGAEALEFRYVAALEAAFGADMMAAGDQISFARIRIRLDLPAGAPLGTYTVIHPYGTELFDVKATGDRAINHTADVGIGAPGVFTGALTGVIGPFLVRADGPIRVGIETFIGDPNVPQAVTGGPNGNRVTVLGPDGNPVIFPGGQVLDTAGFNLAGKLFDGVLPTPLAVERTTYSRSADSSQIDVFATAPATATLEFRDHIDPDAPNTVVTPLQGEGGAFWGQAAEPPSLPPHVIVTATPPDTPPGGRPAALASRLVDLVRITRATYDQDAKVLVIEAASSDQVNQPVLTALGFGELQAEAPGSSLQRRAVVAPPDYQPPARITVKSSAGGEDTESVLVTGFTDDNLPPVITPPTPVAVTAPLCADRVPASHPAIASFLAGATAFDPEDGNLTASLVHDAPTDFPLGMTSVTFSATDSGGRTGAAVSTVTVNQALNTAPVVTAPELIIVLVPSGTSTVPASHPAIAAFLAGATAEDAEEGSLAVSNNAPANFPVGTTVVIFSAIDSCGLDGTALASVTVTLESEQRTQERLEERAQRLEERTQRALDRLQRRTR